MIVEHNQFIDYHIFLRWAEWSDSDLNVIDLLKKRWGITISLEGGKVTLLELYFYREQESNIVITTTTIIIAYLSFTLITSVPCVPGEKKSSFQPQIPYSHP